MTNVLETFSGCGGSSSWKLAGATVRLAVEWDDNAVATYRLNYPTTPVYHGDIGKLTSAAALGLAGLAPGELDVLSGSPPCQGFSTSGKRDMDDNRNQLFKEYARLLRELQPRAFVMENVRGMIIGDMKEIFYEIIAELRDCGYKVKARLLNAKWYGVPQSRERVIFVGIREDLGVEPSHPAPTVERPITVAEALVGVDIKWMPPQLADRYRQLWHRLRPGRSIKDDVMRRINSLSFFSTIKVNPNKPSMTICKTVRRDGFGGICHWAEPRVLAIEEIMRLTSFPDDYQFIGEFEQRWARIGNCVPPLLMKAVADHVLKLIA